LEFLKRTQFDIIVNLHPLSNIFNHAQNSYKFFWWISIIEIVKNRNPAIIYFDEIVLKTISKIWYPVNYFKLNFGSQDQCSKYIIQIKSEFKLNDNLRESELYDFLLTIKNNKIITNISEELTRYVPYRFIRPWFAIATRRIKDHYVNNKILELQDNSAPYQINPSQKVIIINKDWSCWIKFNYDLIKGFAYLELLKYLEKNNPLISNLSLKLEKPAVRKLKKATFLWEEFIYKYPLEKDVFENKHLKDIKKMSIDHFLPWSMSAHDLLWNLHPVEKNVNSSKNNLLPHSEYFDSFSNLQYRFLNFLIETKKAKPLEDYNILLGASKRDLAMIDLKLFQKELDKHYKPNFEIAINMGFTPNWQWSI
jgi:hypothetical protein